MEPKMSAAQYFYASCGSYVTVEELKTGGNERFELDRPPEVTPIMTGEFFSRIIGTLAIISPFIFGYLVWNQFFS